MTGKVLITDDMHETFVDSLVKMGFECNYKPDIEQHDVMNIIADYMGLIISSHIKVDAELIDRANKLLFVGRAGSGMESIDVEYLDKKGVISLNSPEGNKDAVAEHCLGMILALLNNIAYADRQLRQGLWLREENRGEELGGKVVGIIGYGNTGSSFANKLKGLEVEVLAYDKYKHGFGTEGIIETDMDELFQRVDVLSLHIPLNEVTRQMANKAFFDQFKKPLYFINSSRGKIVNTTDMIDALRSGKMLGAVIDVFEHEGIDSLPEEDQIWFDELKWMDNVIMTPHVAGWSHQSRERISTVLIDKIRNHLPELEQKAKLQEL
ncbi:MAG: hypothetical protein IH946_03660 [Bacteroidetes bacterium]|nr:hypothetical protein [Bacteroidota bacterium]